MFVRYEFVLRHNVNERIKRDCLNVNLNLEEPGSYGKLELSAKFLVELLSYGKRTRYLNTLAWNERASKPSNCCVLSLMIEPINECRYTLNTMDEITLHKTNWFARKPVSKRYSSINRRAARS